MKKIYMAAVASAMLATAVSAEDTKKEGFALTIQDQIRYEGVSQPDNALKDATALTNRFVLGGGYTVSGFGLYVEGTNVSALTDTYNDKAGNGTDYSVVADPAQTRITQAKLNYKGKDFGAVIGRDMYTLDGHRFMGSVAWRQMPQTFDVAALCYKGVENLKVKAAYVFGRHGVLAYDDVLATQKLTTAGAGFIDPLTNSVMLNANYTISKDMSARLYDYMISSTSDTFGGMVEGKAGSLGYKVEAALQTTASLTTVGQTAPVEKDATVYTNVELSTKALGTKFILAHEILGGNGTTSFQTPWATLHKFNGWADVYLGGTPVDGLADSSLGAVYANEKLGTFKAFYHIYNDAAYTTNQGNELDILYTRDAGIKGLKFLTKAAFYTAGTLSTDTTKVWAMLTYNYQN